MKFLNIYNLPEEKAVKAGRLLIAEPFLLDANFARTVIFICEHSEDGSVGFVLNRPTDITLHDILPDLTSGSEVNQGGPVELDTLHMLHRCPKLLGGNEISPGVYWGGSYEMMQELVADKKLKADDVKLFLGYSGWSPGQLETEMKDGSWIVAEPTDDILFATESKLIWRNAIYSMGKKYEILANMPLHPQLN